MGTARMGVILSRNFLWWKFSRWELSGGNHPGGNFPGGSFHVTKYYSPSTLLKAEPLPKYF